jgi:CBS-domain-containing membrane protein
MLVNSLMTPNPAACRSCETLQDAARIMWERDVGAVPVIDACGRVIGVVTDRDVCMAAFTQGRLLSTIPIPVAMSRCIYTCQSHDDVGLAEGLMREARVRRLPVVDREGKLVGMLSLNDLAREAVHDRHRDDAPQPADLAATLAVIGDPRCGGRTEAGRT